MVTNANPENRRRAMHDPRLKPWWIFFVLLGSAICPAMDVNSEIVNFQHNGVNYRLEQYITTHFWATSGDGQYGGLQEDGYYEPYYGKDADLRFLNLDKDGYCWDDSVKPSYNNYYNQITAHTEVKVRPDGSNDRNNNGVADEIEEFEREIFVRSGYRADILNYNPYVSASSYLFENHNTVQIVNNVIFGDTLFTLYFPPGWNRKRSLPMVIVSHGFTVDNNEMYINKQVDYAVCTALSVKYGQGMIVVQSNCGGRESLGLNYNAMRDLGEFLTKIMTRYGADPSRVITTGGSRAGNVALVWGANPLGYDYEVHSIHAFVPAIKVGSMSSLSYASFPSLNTAINTILGSVTAYRSDYIDKTTGEIMMPEDKASAAMNVLLGVTSADEADSKSAYGCYIDDSLVPSLRQKRIVLSQSTHDSFMPLPYFLDFDNALTQQEIPHISAIGYCYGHSYVFAIGCGRDQQTVLKQLIEGQEIKPFTLDEAGRMFFVPKRLYNTGTGTMRQGATMVTDEIIAYVNELRPGYFADDHDGQKLVFTATIPCRVRQGQPMTITLAGEKGKSWKIWARPESGYRPIYSMSGVFGQELDNQHVLEWGDEYVVLHLKAWKPADRYEWFFEYDGKEIPNRFTPFVSPEGVAAKAVTEVVNREPDLREYWHEFAADDSENFGVDQYHPLLSQPNADPVIIEPIGWILVNAGQEARIQLQANDPDGDELIYDVRNRYNEFLSGDIEFNGLTGELILGTSIGDIGYHIIKAIAKDGKGGIGERYFYLLVN